MIIFFLCLILSFVCFLLGTFYAQFIIRINLDGCIKAFSASESRDNQIATVVLRETYKLLFKEESKY